LIGDISIFTNLVRPIYDEIQVLRDKKESGQKLLVDQRAAVDSVNKLLSDYESFTQIQENISQILPNKEGVPGVVNQLQGLATVNNLKVASLGLQYPPLKSSTDETLIKPLGTLRVTIGLAGDYKDLKPYLEDLETNIRLIDVYSISVANGAIPGATSLLYSIVLDTYYQ